MEEHLKTIEQCLRFYADENNYKDENKLILKDGGFQARQIINLIKEIEKDKENLYSGLDLGTNFSNFEQVINQMKNL